MRGCPPSGTSAAGPHGSSRRNSATCSSGRSSLAALPGQVSDLGVFTLPQHPRLAAAPVGDVHAFADPAGQPPEPAVLDAGDLDRFTANGNPVAFADIAGLNDAPAGL